MTKPEPDGVTRFAPVLGADIAYRVFGDGPPLVAVGNLLTKHRGMGFQPDCGPSDPGELSDHLLGRLQLDCGEEDDTAILVAAIE